ncbi:MAG TPA: hypothetical protein VFN46_10580, partial [Acetobacteraceae bacterium]|nr:hypothetical protein [Acetobacteraceae bacterium]
MRRLPVFLPLLCCLLFAACAGPRRADQEAAAQARIAAEVLHLRASLAAEVPRQAGCGQDTSLTWIIPVQAALRAAGVGIDRPQLIVAVDRNPRHQRMCLLLARPHASWDVIGGDHVSTGQDGRHGYFITPTGVFPHTAAILDWRAEGTFNENGIR